jgi:diguanylate cyclase (GGDEF)-like protein
MWLALLAWSAPAVAQTAKVGVPVRTCLARVVPGDTAARVLAAPDRLDCATPPGEFGEGDYWVAARDLPAAAGLAPRTVRSGSLWQRGMTLWVAYADGRLIGRRVDDRAAREVLQLGAMFELPIPVRGVRATALLWRVEGAANVRGIVAAPHVATPEQGVASNLLFGSLYAAFGGLCLALLVYNFALWRVLRHDFQLAYCAMLVALAGYAVTSSGVLSWWIDIANTDRIRLNYVLLALAGIAAVVFARRFFEDRVFGRWLDRLGLAACAALAATSGGFALFAPRAALLFDRAYSGAFLLLMAYAGAVLWRAWRVRANHLWLFALAWAAPIVFAGLRLAGELRLIGITFWLDNSTLMAMAAEALLSSVAISYRLRLLLVERDAAIAGETAAKALADSDPLTGLLNRRSFLREAIGSTERRTLVLADIDHFKLVNDTLGHDGGDEVLRRFARALAEAAPPGALVARVGGEEFAVLAPATFTLLPEVLIAAVRAARMPFDLQVTASLGSETGVVATESDWSRLYRNADEALYAAKRAGRDRIRHAPAALAA